MKKTRKQYEQYLNASYADSFSSSQAEDHFEYLASRSRVKRTNIKRINEAYQNHELGSLLRKFDPIAFNVGFNEWSK